MEKAHWGGKNEAYPRDREMRETETTLLELLDLAIPEADAPHFSTIV